MHISVRGVLPQNGTLNNIGKSEYTANVAHMFTGMKIDALKLEVNSFFNSKQQKPSQEIDGLENSK